MAKPETCPTCESPKIIPIIYGSPGRELYDLAVMGKAELRGCDAAQEGDPLWHCAECNESLRNPMFQSREVANTNTIEEEVASLLALWRPLSAEEIPSRSFCKSR